MGSVEILAMLYLPTHGHSISQTSPTTPTILIRMLCWDIPKTNPPGWMIHERVAHKSQHTDKPMALICYIKRVQRVMRKGKWYTGHSPWETRSKLPRSAFQVEYHRRHLISFAKSYDETCELLPTGRFIRDLESQVFVEG